MGDERGITGPGNGVEDVTLDRLGVPNCPTDLMPMELLGTEEHPYWHCDYCGLNLVS